MLESHLMTDLGSPWILKRGVDNKANYLYLDNVGFLNDKNVIVKSAIDQTASHFNQIGLNLHEIMIYAEG